MEYTGANMDLKKPEITDEITTAIVAYGDNFQDIDDYVTAHINSIIAHLDSSIVNTAPIPGSKVRDAMINLKSQVDAIVVGGTEVDPRLSQALVDFESTTWTNFKDLQDFWQERIVVLEDEVNTPDTSSIILSELAQLQTVTDSYDGIPDVEIGSATLNQAITEGDFDAGTTGWYGNNGTIAVVDKLLSQTGTGASASPYVVKNPAMNLPISVGMKIFIEVRKVRVTNSSCLQLRVGYRGTTGGATTTAESKVSPAINTWYTIKKIITVPSGYTGNLDLFIFQDYSTSEIANGKAMEVEGDWTKGGGIFIVPMTGTPYESEADPEIMSARLNEYWEGLKSPESIELLSRGINKHDTELEQGSLSLTNGSNASTTTAFRSKNFILLDSAESLSTQSLSDYKILRIVYYNKNKDFVASYTINSSAAQNNLSRPTTGTYKFIRFVWQRNDLGVVGSVDFDYINENAMLNYGATALSHEDYKGSTLKITCNDKSKFDLAKLPNLAQNDIKIADGKRLANKRVNRNVLLSSGIVSELLTLTNLDVYYTSAFTDNSAWTAGVDDKVMVDKFLKEVDSGFTDVATNAYSFYASPTAVLALIVPKGTYANLTAAQAGLAGTVVYYQLATPIVIEEVDLPQYGINIEGSLASNSDYTEWVVNDYDLFAPVTITYPANISESVNGLKESVSGLRITTDSKADKAQPPIVHPVLLNSWVNFGGAFRNIGYYVNSVNELVFQGMIKDGVITTGTVIFTLDPDVVDLTAIVGMNIPVLTNGVFGYIDILANGDVRCRDVNATYISFEGKNISLNKN